MNEVSNKQWVGQLGKDLDKFAKFHEQVVPSKDTLHLRIQGLKRKERQNKRRELIWFMMTAVLILVIYVTVILKASIVFIFIQFIAIMLIPFVIIRGKRRLPYDGDMIDV